MKLAPLLAKYLYTSKKLNLPGIGTFQIDSSIEVEPESGKQGKINPLLAGVSFENNPSITDDPDLVQFIASETGKLKALAAADLESHLELIQQFLNIGKPYLLEGIGTLVKLKPKEIAFTSGQIIPESMKDFSAKEISSASSSDVSFSDYRNAINKEGFKTGWRNPITVILVLIGVFLAVWGGYTVYKMTAKQNNTRITKENNNPVVLPKDTVTVQKDTAQQVKTEPVPVPASVTGKLKFIIEKATAKRAYERYNKLRGYFWPVQLETADSVHYTIYMILPASGADAARIMDSLTLLNGRRVYLEN